MYTKLVDLLNAYLPDNEQEKKHKEDMLSFLKENPDCFERSCLKGHFTGSSWLLSKDKQKALILHHKKLDKWLQLGGHCDGDNDVLNVAIKEAQEESGIINIIPLSNKIFDIDIHTIPARLDVLEHLHLDVRFLLMVSTDEDFVQNHESIALKWIHIDDDNSPEELRRMIIKWREHVKNVSLDTI